MLKNLKISLTGCKDFLTTQRNKGTSLSELKIWKMLSPNSKRVRVKG